MNSNVNSNANGVSVSGVTDGTHSDCGVESVFADVTLTVTGIPIS